MPAFEDMLPQDLPVLEQDLAEASEVERNLPAPAQETALVERMVHRPLPSAMLTRLGRWARLIVKLFFGHVLFERRSQDTLRDANESGTVVYVMKSHSRLDYLYFNHAFLEHGLPLARIANGVSLRPFRRFWSLLTRPFRRARLSPEKEMEALVRHGHSAFLFLERPKQSNDEALAYSQPYLYRLIRAQKRQDDPILVVPLLLVWEKRPEPHRASFLDDIFGTVQAPGFFRKFLHYFQTFWQSFLKFGQPMVQVSSAINLRNFLREYPNADSSDATELLRARLEDFIHRERHVILGPTSPSREDIHREVLHRPELVEHIQALAEAGEDEKALKKQARKQLYEISADTSLLMLKFFSAGLSYVWYRIYEGFEIDEEGLEEVRKAIKSSSVILVPSHKSHIDYLVLSYVFYHYGLMTPHIAAGVNLSFWPLGPIFRRAGAFFIRRSFRGEGLYPVVFQEYLIRLMEERYPIEFFIEGTRSRTGKLIKPKYGMLDMMIRAYAAGRLESVKFVPISVGYEKIIEERSYRRELLGEEKRRESLTDLLKTPKYLTSKKGRLYVEFDEPIDLGEYFAKYGIDRLEPDDEDLDALTVRLAHRIIFDINQITTVSPTALAAAVLLNTPARGVDRQRLLHEVGFLIHFLVRPGRKIRLSGALREALASREEEIDQVRRAAGGDPAPSLRFDPTAHPDALRARHVEAAMGAAVASVMERALGIFEAEGQVVIRQEEDEEFFSLHDEHRLDLAFYRNTLIQHFVPESLLATAILKFDGPRIALDALREETRFLSRLFKYEWIYEERAEFENVFSRTLQDFLENQWLSTEDDEDGTTWIIVAEPSTELTYFRRIVLTFLEAYAIAMNSLDLLQEGRQDKKDLIDHMLQRGRKGYLRGDVIFHESLSKPTFLNALRLLEDWGAVERQIESGRVRETTYFARSGEWPAERYWQLQQRIDGFVYRDWELRNQVSGRRGAP